MSLGTRLFSQSSIVKAAARLEMTVTGERGAIQSGDDPSLLLTRAGDSFLLRGGQALRSRLSLLWVLWLFTSSSSSSSPSSRSRSDKDADIRALQGLLWRTGNRKGSRDCGGVAPSSSHDRDRWGKTRQRVVLLYAEGIVLRLTGRVVVRALSLPSLGEVNTGRFLWLDVRDCVFWMPRCWCNVCFFRNETGAFGEWGLSSTMHNPSSGMVKKSLSGRNSDPVLLWSLSFSSGCWQFILKGNEWKSLRRFKVSGLLVKLFVLFGSCLTAAVVNAVFLGLHWLTCSTKKRQLWSRSSDKTWHMPFNCFLMSSIRGKATASQWGNKPCGNGTPRERDTCDTL